jgi:hypothetical protein
MIIPYTVISDTREQHPWEFVPNQYCKGTIHTALPTGDYTLEGYEKLLCIERKGSTNEFSQNICQVRFKNELERMKSFKYAFIVCEFTMDDILNFPKNSGIPPKLWPRVKVSPYFILKSYIEIEVLHNVKIILAGTHGKDVASSIFKRVTENEYQAGRETVKKKNRNR